MKLKYWIISARPKPLILGLGPVFIGICLSFFKAEGFNWILNGTIIFCVLCLQIATHFFNDALDFLKGADTDLRKGPQRAVQKKIITPEELIKAGFVCLFLAVLASFYLVLQAPWIILSVGTLSLILTYCYTGGRYPLAYTGLADFVVILFFGVIPVTIVFYLNTNYADISSLIVGFQYGFLALNIFIINNLRDYKEDKKAGKKTLVVRFGSYFGMLEWTVAHYFPYVLGVYFLFQTKSEMFWYPLLILPFSIYIHLKLREAYYKESLYPKIFIFTLRHYLLFVSLTCFMHLFL